MADRSVGARDEFHESEASEASVFSFDKNASPEKSCFVDGLVCFISLCLRVFEFLNATRREGNLPQERKSFFFSFPDRLCPPYLHSVYGLSIPKIYLNTKKKQPQI